MISDFMPALSFALWLAAHLGAVAAIRKSDEAWPSSLPTRRRRQLLHQRGQQRGHRVGLLDDQDTSHGIRQGV